MLITELQPDDWEKLKNITLESLKTDPEAFATNYQKKLAFDETKWRSWLAPFRYSSASVTLFALNDEGAAIGKVTALLANPEFIEVVGMIVSKEERRKGTGKQLLTELLKKIAPMVKKRKIVLEVNSELEAAVNLYLSMGFRKTGSSSAVLGDGKSHELTKMELS